MFINTVKKVIKLSCRFSLKTLAKEKHTLFRSTPLGEEPDNDIEKSSIALEFDIDRLKTKINCRLCPSVFCCDVFICIFLTRTAVLAATARQRRTTAQPGTCRVWWHFFYRHLIINWNYNSVQISILLDSNASNITQCLYL